MGVFRNGFVMSSLFVVAGLSMLAWVTRYPPGGIFSTLFLVFACIGCFLMAPRGAWIARQLRYRDFLRSSGEFASAEDAWTAFERQDALPRSDDPLLRRWQALVDAKIGNDAAPSPSNVSSPDEPARQDGREQASVKQ